MQRSHRVGVAYSVVGAPMASGGIRMRALFQTLTSDQLSSGGDDAHRSRRRTASVAQILQKLSRVLSLVELERQFP